MQVARAELQWAVGNKGEAIRLLRSSFDATIADPTGAERASSVAQELVPWFIKERRIAEAETVLEAVLRKFEAQGEITDPNSAGRVALLIAQKNAADGNLLGVENAVLRSAAIHRRAPMSDIALLDELRSIYNQAEAESTRLRDESRRKREAQEAERQAAAAALAACSTARSAGNDFEGFIDQSGYAFRPSGPTRDHVSNQADADYSTHEYAADYSMPTIDRYTPATSALAEIWAEKGLSTSRPISSSGTLSSWDSALSYTTMLEMGISPESAIKELRRVIRQLV